MAWRNVSNGSAVRVAAVGLCTLAATTGVATTANGSAGTNFAAQADGLGLTRRRRNNCNDAWTPTCRRWAAPRCP